MGNEMRVKETVEKIVLFYGIYEPKKNIIKRFPYPYYTIDVYIYIYERVHIRIPYSPLHSAHVSIPYPLPIPHYMVILYDDSECSEYIEFRGEDKMS